MLIRFSTFLGATAFSSSRRALERHPSGENKLKHPACALNDFRLCRAHQFAEDLFLLPGIEHRRQTADVANHFEIAHLIPPFTNSEISRAARPPATRLRRLGNRP
jgi:hypothetical protein